MGSRDLFLAIPKVKGAVRGEDHHTIALISLAIKILLRILLNRMKFAAEEQIADVQMGFRQGVGTRDQFFNLRFIMAFIDYKKAFDSVKHSKL